MRIKAHELLRQLTFARLKLGRAPCDDAVDRHVGCIFALQLVIRDPTKAHNAACF
jgi:hypothetical protein